MVAKVLRKAFFGEEHNINAVYNMLFGPGPSLRPVSICWVGMQRKIALNITWY